MCMLIHNYVHESCTLCTYVMYVCMQIHSQNYVPHVHSYIHIRMYAPQQNHNYVKDGVVKLHMYNSPLTSIDKAIYLNWCGYSLSTDIDRLFYEVIQHIR